MRILMFTDNHFSEKSSIVTKYGTNFTLRLENQIKSLNWVERLAHEKECDLVVCLGDFFDHAHLTDQELTALDHILWNSLDHYFLVGNHESEENDLQYSSTMALAGVHRYIISEPIIKQIDTDTELAFLPYIVESNRKAITEYFEPKSTKTRILLSHNDLLGIQLGPVVSRTGFSIDELESIASITFNGHLHNGQAISDRVINLGNLTGSNFSEDASRYSHKVAILDTETLKYEYIENPFAFNFYKLDINEKADIMLLENLKQNAVVSIKCKDFLLQEVRETLARLENIIESRVIITKDLVEAGQEVTDISSLVVDQCAKFAECCRAKLDNNAILEAELAEILK